MKFLKKGTNSSICISLLELVRLRIAQINDCKYCAEIHYEELRYLEYSDLRLSLVPIWNEVPYFSKKEKALLALTDNLINLNIDKPSDEVYKVLLPYFSEKEICRLTLAIKQIDSWTMAMKAYSCD